MTDRPKRKPPTLATKVAVLERWLPVPEFEGIYEVSDQGRVRSVFRVVEQPSRWDRSKTMVRKLRGTLMRQQDNGHGYLSVLLRKDGRYHRRYVHRLVCAAFNGPAPSPDHEAAHWNGEKKNNVPDNLRWATRRENVIDNIRLGRMSVPAPRSHCKRGHEMTLANTRLAERGGMVKRVCRECARRHQRAAYWRRKEVCE